MPNAIFDEYSQKYGGFRGNYSPLTGIAKGQSCLFCVSCRLQKAYRDKGSEDAL